MIKLQKTEIIEFDCNLERKRIQGMSNEPLKVKLLALVDFFEKGDLHGVERVLNDQLAPNEHQFAHTIITETMSEMKRRDRFVSYKFIQKAN